MQDYVLPSTQQRQRGIVRKAERICPKQKENPTTWDRLRSTWIDSTRLSPTLSLRTRHPATQPPAVRRESGVCERVVVRLPLKGVRSGNEKLVQNRNGKERPGKFFRPTWPDLARLGPTWPDMTPHDPTNSSHHVRVRTTLVQRTKTVDRARQRWPGPHHSPSHELRALQVRQHGHARALSSNAHKRIPAPARPVSAHQANPMHCCSDNPVNAC